MTSLLKLLLTLYLVQGISTKTCDDCLEESVQKTLELYTPDEKITPADLQVPVQMVPATSSVSILCNATKGSIYKSWTLVQGDQDISLAYGSFDNIKIVEKDGVHSLDIQHVRTDQAGTYVCETVDSSGTMQYLRLHLIVKGAGGTTSIEDFSAMPSTGDEVTTRHQSVGNSDEVTPSKESVMMTPVNTGDVNDTLSIAAGAVTKQLMTATLSHLTGVTEEVTDDMLTDSNTVESTDRLGTTFHKTNAQFDRDSLNGVSGVLVAPGNAVIATAKQFNDEDCSNTKYGCCEDGFTVATDDNKLGCPESFRLALEIGFPTTDRAVQFQMLYQPQNFKIVRDAVASDRVSIKITWDVPRQGFPPNEYLIRFSDNVSIDRNYWSKVTRSTNEWRTALRRPSIHFFTVSSLAGEIESKQTAVYMYDTEEEMSKLYRDNCVGEECAVTTEVTPTTDCLNTRWGCCLDGVTTALGPDRLGCNEDDQSCALSQYECCPDGLTKAMGDNFEGCGDGLIIIDNEVNPICLEEPDKARCTNYTVQWHYDLAIKRCRRFWYGGCANNLNRFTTQAKCAAVCGSGTKPENGGPTCSQPSAVTGSCKGSFPRWTYNKRTNQCEQFYYGGCQGNDNKFLTSDNCEKKCLNVDEGKDVCSLPKDSGPCMAMFTRWFYDGRERACKEFIYGGCEGNQNRFQTKQDCLSRCDQIDTTSPQDICLLPQLQGPCRGRISQYSYDPNTGRCKEFFYGGCEGSANRFNDEQTCLAACGLQTREGESVCLLEADAGPCRGNFIHWFYDITSGLCSRFVYGGCQGNANNFRTEEECETSCVVPQATQVVPTNDVCSLDFEIGSCDGYEIQWFYDKERDVCRRFIYTGCGGNSNRFNDEAMCNAVCKSSGFVTTTKRVIEETTPFAGRKVVITNSEDKQYAANIGDDVTIRCRAIGYPQPRYIWYMNRSPLDVTAKPIKYQLTESVGDLTIRGLTASDAAEYICRAHNDVGPPDYLYTNLVVTDQVTILAGDEDMVGTIGGEVILECLATGFPAPSISWSFFGAPIEDAQSGSTLRLISLTYADEGNYICTADNGVTFDRKIITLTVVEPLTVGLAEHNKSYTEGEDLTLTCVALSYTPAFVSWMKEGVKINASSRVVIRETTLTVNSLMIADSGFYSCVATNNRETAVASTSIQVTRLVTTPPPILGPCGDRPYLANCKLIVYYGFCTHEVYQHLCCKSCVDAGKISRYSIKPSPYSAYSPFKYRSNMAARRRMRR